MKKSSIKINTNIIGKISKAIISILLVVCFVFSCVLYFGTSIDENKGFDKSNNGYELYSKEIDRLINVKPTELQVQFSDIGYYSFIHYGMNTFTGKEWGDGTENEKLFCPEVVDTDQWVKVLKDSGSKAIIFTAKHHDGFCLFQTDYTEHSIKNSPYQNGKGDIVKQLAESCKKYDMKLGIYLSPWDRNNKDYGTDTYNDFFVNQLTELCTNYGDIFCFWFDGAKGEDAPDFEYDWESYYDVIHKLQPNALIANCGPDVRWIGNEAGVARESEWSVITSGDASVKATMNGSQKNENSKALQEVDKTAQDLGSRALVSQYKDLVWYPAEADVSIHNPEWFYREDSKIRTPKELANIYFKTVGGNASMLLNVPPSKNGVIEDKDVEVLQEFKQIIDDTFKNKVEYTATTNGKNLNYNIESDEDFYQLLGNESTITFTLNEKHKIKTIVLKEDIRYSQRVEEFEIYAKVPGGYKRIYKGTTIGSEKIAQIKFPYVRNTNEIKIVFTQSRYNPVIRTVELYE